MEIKGEQINEALKNIYNKNIDVKKQIEPTLFHHTWSNLNNTVDITFGKVEFGNPDYDFVNQLKNNNAVFAAFKTHREQNDLIPNLWDDNGKLRSFDDFKKANSHIVSKYEHWLRTEYDTAVIRARNAANFQKFKRDADLYPNLEWLPSTSVEPRGEHVKFYGIIKPINDPFWSNNYPGDLWNCKCGITSTDKEPTENTPSNDYIKPQGLEENPATSGALFSNKNAYVKNAYEGANEAVNKHIEQNVPLFKELKRYDNGGIVFKNTLVVKNSDYQSVKECCDFFAKKGDQSYIYPKINKTNKLYDIVYPELKNTIYYGKSPDFKRNNKYYELEGYITSLPDGSTIGKMIKRGLEQSQRVVITHVPKTTNRYYVKRLNDILRSGKFDCKELWIKDGKSLWQVY